MSHAEDVESGYYKAEDYYDKHPEELSEECCGQTMVLDLTTVYGDDADGNRGVPLHVYVCSVCEQEKEVIG